LQQLPDGVAVYTLPTFFINHGSRMQAPLPHPVNPAINARTVNGEALSASNKISIDAASEVVFFRLHRFGRNEGKNLLDDQSS
jgi:hypothetical protein